MNNNVLRAIILLTNVGVVATTAALVHYGYKYGGVGFLLGFIVAAVLFHVAYRLEHGRWWEF